MNSQRLKIVNPKRATGARVGRASWYPYYAGFSQEFASALLRSAGLAASSVVLDPWNGSGTTTSAASEIGIGSVGVDLNPVMVLVARARLLPVSECTTAIALAHEVSQQSAEGRPHLVGNDPLDDWFLPKTRACIRKLERVIFRLTVSHTGPVEGGKSDQVFDSYSCTAAFMYLGLFRTVRSLLSSFGTANPTWIRKARSASERVAVDADFVRCQFLGNIADMAGHFLNPVQSASFAQTSAEIRWGSSLDLPMGDSTVDFVLTSPPYCTRLDYAVATAPELAVLGASSTATGASLRGSLLGTSTVPKDAPLPCHSWGNSCLRFLSAMKQHRSKASCSYYYKNHAQYFASLHASINEVSRVLKPGATAAIVVQDSFYKDLHNDLPQILTEMGAGAGLHLVNRVDHLCARNIGWINTKSRSYRSVTRPSEAVICLEKEAA